VSNNRVWYKQLEPNVAGRPGATVVVHDNVAAVALCHPSDIWDDRKGLAVALRRLRRRLSSNYNNFDVDIPVNAAQEARIQWIKANVEFAAFNSHNHERMFQAGWLPTPIVLPKEKNPLNVSGSVKFTYNDEADWLLNAVLGHEKQRYEDNLLPPAAGPITSPFRDDTGGGQLWFRHIRPGSNGKLGATIVVTKDSGGALDWCVVTCNPNDEWSDDVGLSEVMKRWPDVMARGYTGWTHDPNFNSHHSQVRRDRIKTSVRFAQNFIDDSDAMLNAGWAPVRAGALNTEDTEDDDFYNKVEDYCHGLVGLILRSANRHTVTNVDVALKAERDTLVAKVSEQARRIDAWQHEAEMRDKHASRVPYSHTHEQAVTERELREAVRVGDHEYQALAADSAELASIAKAYEVREKELRAALDAACATIKRFDDEHDKLNDAARIAGCELKTHREQSNTVIAELCERISSFESRNIALADENGKLHESLVNKAKEHKATQAALTYTTERAEQLLNDHNELDKEMDRVRAENDALKTLIAGTAKATIVRKKKVT